MAESADLRNALILHELASFLARYIRTYIHTYVPSQSAQECSSFKSPLPNRAIPAVMHSLIPMPSPSFSMVHVEKQEGVVREILCTICSLHNATLENRSFRKLPDIP